MTVELSY